MNQDKQIYLMIIGVFFIILFISSFIGYYFGNNSGIFAFVGGVLMIIVPTLLFLREINNPDVKPKLGNDEQ